MEPRISMACQDIALSVEALLRRERMRTGLRQQAPARQQAAAGPRSPTPLAPRTFQPQPQPDSPGAPVDQLQAVRQVIDQRLEILRPVDGETGTRSRGLLLQLRGLLEQLEARLRGRRDHT